MDNRNAILRRRKKGSAAAEEKITDLEASENTNLEPEIDSGSVLKLCYLRPAARKGYACQTKF